MRAQAGRLLPICIWARRLTFSDLQEFIWLQSPSGKLSIHGNSAQCFFQAKKYSSTARLRWRCLPFRTRCFQSLMRQNLGNYIEFILFCSVNSLISCSAIRNKLFCFIFNAWISIVLWILFCWTFIYFFNNCFLNVSISVLYCDCILYIASDCLKVETRVGIDWWELVYRIITAC